MTATTTDIELLHQHLDVNPTDHIARLVLADALAESGVAELEVLAEGYRALAVNERDCTQNKRNFTTDQCPYWLEIWEAATIQGLHFLPKDWFGCLEVEGTDIGCAPWWKHRCNATRRELDDAAALAFSKLPQQRKDELLKGGG